MEAASPAVRRSQTGLQEALDQRDHEHPQQQGRRGREAGATQCPVSGKRGAGHPHDAA